MRKLLILSDTLDFGGHEIAFLVFFLEMLKDSRFDRMIFLIPAENARFRSRLAEIGDPRVEIRASPFSKGPGEPYFAPVRFGYRKFLREQYQDIAPDTVLLLQGRIENLCVASLALPKDADVVSYIPMAHSIVELRGKSWKSRTQDLVRRFYYRRPNRYIVPSRAVAKQLAANGARGPVSIARNFVPEDDNIDKNEAKKLLNLSEKARIASFIGRFDAQQKGIDLLLPLIEKSKNWTFLFIGTGEYENELRASRDRGAPIEIVGWTDQVAAYMSATDVLLLPSRYEGVPLTLLQALRTGTPVVASPIDAYLEYLPPENIFSFETATDIDTVLDAVSAPVLRDAYLRHAHLMLSETLDLVASSEVFRQALDGSATKS